MGSRDLLFLSLSTSTGKNNEMVSHFQGHPESRQQALGLLHQMDNTLQTAEETLKKASALLLVLDISFVELSDWLFNVVAYQVAAYSFILKGTSRTFSFCKF